jgi:hypothetical protein
MKAIATISILVLAGAVTVARAADGRGGEAGFFAGALFPDVDVAGDDEPATETTFGARVGVFFTPRWSWFVDATTGEIDGSTGFGAAEELAGRTGVELLFRPRSRLGLFLNTGLGWVNYDYERGGSLDFDRPIWSAAAGASFRVGARMKLRAEWRGDVTLDDRGLDGVDVSQGRLTGGLSWGPRMADAGGSVAAPSADLDRDGARNGKDRCPETPLGATVTAHGCPSDLDRDGVYDGIDRCPSSVAASRVDATGCLLDTDGDGVSDGSDACRDTAKGLPVDEWGCPEDLDGDRVPDGLDRCAHTPLGSRVDDAGCPIDTDGDGVPDGLDRCSATAVGAAIDRRGCPVSEP